MEAVRVEMSGRSVSIYSQDRCKRDAKQINKWMVSQSINRIIGSERFLWQKEVYLKKMKNKKDKGYPNERLSKDESEATKTQTE